MSNSIVDQINNYLEQNKFDSVRSLVLQLNDCEYVERVVHTVLKNPNITPDFLDFVLNHFLSTREDNIYTHKKWVHSLSHFTKEIWELKHYDWIKKFNEVSFKGAVELNTTFCCDRLVMDFLRYHTFDASPLDYYIDVENLAWLDWTNFYNPNELKQELKNSPFKSQESLLRFRLNGTLNSKEWISEIQKDATSTKAFDSLLTKLQSEGVDISEFDSQKAELYTKRLQSLVDLRGQVREQYNDVLEQLIHDQLALLS
jgi:hypothetical protein